MCPVLARYERQTTRRDADSQKFGGERIRRVHHQKIQNTQQIGKIFTFKYYMNKFRYIRKKHHYQF